MPTRRRFFLIASLAVALVSAACFSFCPAAAAEENAALSITIPTVASPPPVDGTLNSPVWQQGAKVTLGYDRQTHGAAAETTTAYLLTDGKALYVAFEAQQTRTPIVATQHTNNVGVDTDDEVKINLWPGGASGLSYQFISTPLGTRYQVSSENLSYEPNWDAAGKIGNHVWYATMRIPLEIMRGAKQNAWMVQFSRWEVTTGSLYLWSGGRDVTGTGDNNYARPLLHMPATRAQRPKPRFGIYGLAQTGSAGTGGTTSRSGADISIPLTEGTSFVATLHPDFSNVERDQQSIAPTAFRRFFSETRPFFTQGANFYNVYECDACPNENSLYTPSIPTPRDGYAVEGNEGHFSFGSFDAIGADRNDNAQAVTYRTTPRNLFVSAQRVSANLPGLKDDTMQFATKWSDLKHKFVYANYGTEQGTNVTDPSQGRFEEFGGGIFGPFSFVGGGIRKIGAQYNPYDGFVSNSGIAGYGFFAQHQWLPLGGKAKSITLNGFIDRYQSTVGAGTAQSDQSIFFDIVTRKLWEGWVDTGSSYLLIGNVIMPITQNQYGITYGSGSSTPTTVTFASGIFGSGRLNSWSRNSTVRINRRALLTLEADDTRQYLPQGVQTQWLERASVAFQQDRDTSFAVGLRRIIGTPPILSGIDNSCTSGCTNLSFAYHKRFGPYELYTAYGDPSRLYTQHDFLMKLIRYVGADKGT